MAIPYIRGLSAGRIALLGALLLLLLVEATYSLWWAVGDVLIRTVPAAQGWYKPIMVDLVLGTPLLQDMLYFAGTAFLTMSFAGLVMRRSWAFWAYAAASVLFNLDWIFSGLSGNDLQPEAGYFSMVYAGLVLLLLWISNRLAVTR